MIPANPNVGSIYAINAVTGKTEWKFEQRAATMSLLTGVPGAARYVTLQDASSNPILRLYSHVNGAAFPVARVYGDLWPDNDSTRKLGASNLVWSQIYASQLYLNDINPRPGVPQIFLVAALLNAAVAVATTLA